MVNVIAAVRPLVHGLVKLAGLTPQTIEIEPGTVMRFWVPKQTVAKTKNPRQKWNKPEKPVLVFAHPFAADGILMWAFQVLAFAGDYAVYVPDFLFFGGSTTTRSDRSPAFQANCLAKSLRKIGVEKCTVIGLSYGGMVGFKMAELYPELVEALVVSSTVNELTESISKACFQKIGISSWPEFLLPESEQGVNYLFSVGTHKLPRLPNFVYRDILQALFDNRKEKAQLLEALVTSGEESTTPNFSQRIHFLWGDDDKIFGLELAKASKRDWERKPPFNG